MRVRKIEKSIDITAPAAKVWDVLLKDEYNTQWYAEFSEGTVADTDWQVGSKALFRDHTDCGIAGKIAANEPNRFLDIEYFGVINDGKEDYDSDFAKSFRGTHETYTLTESDGVTKLDVTLDMGEEYYDMMSTQWDSAMIKIKDLAEA